MTEAETLILTGLAFALGGGIFFVIGFVIFRKTRTFRARATRTSGEVIHVTRKQNRRNNGTNSITYKPTFRFTDVGGRVQERPTFYSSSSYDFEVGSMRDILHTDSDSYVMPADGGGAFVLPGVFMGLGGLCMLIGGGMAVWASLPG